MEKLKVKKSDIRKWVNALRSGKYKQCKGELNARKNHYCCLGVACEIFIPERKKERSKNGNLIGSYPIMQDHSPRWLYKIDTHMVSDVSEVLKEANVAQSSLGRFLSVLNDAGNYTFDEIADCLELVYIHEAIKNN